MSPRINQGKFETLDHTGYDGANQLVPLFVDREKGLSDVSNALLQAVNIIGANLDHFGNDVSALHCELTKIVAVKSEAGIIIEDSHGAGAVNIDPENTIVTVHSLGEWHIPTELLADMVGYWAQVAVEKS